MKIYPKKTIQINGRLYLCFFDTGFAYAWAKKNGFENVMATKVLINGKEGSGFCVG